MKALVPQTTSALDLSPATWTMMKEQATLLVKSGLLPTSVRTPEAAIAIMLKGRELGIPAMQAFAQISIINGKPAVGAELMLGLIYRRYPGAPIHIEKNDVEVAVVQAGRPGAKKLTTFRFDQADAKRAGLLGKSTWQQYPQMMLYWRCVSMMARQLYPECLMGASHTPEELGAEVNEDGEVLEIPAERPRAIQPAPREPEVLDVAPPEPEVYSPTSENDHERRLAAILKRMKIDEVLWERVGTLLVGKPMVIQYVNAAIAEATAEIER